MRRWEYPAALLILAAVAAAGTLFAVWAYPIWDDAYLETMALDHTREELAASALDRPISGQISAWLVVERGRYFVPPAAAHWLISFGLAWFTLYQGRTLFPRHPAVALATACLAATPVMYRTQIALVSHPMVGLSVVTSFVAVYLVAGTVRRKLSPWNAALRWVVAAAALVAGGLVTEYFIASTLGGIAWIVFLAWDADAAARARSYRAAVALFLLMLATYVIYHQTATAEVRTAVRPEVFLLQDIPWRAKVTLPVWLSYIYSGCVGVVLEQIGSLRLQTNVDLLGIAAGAVLAAAIWLATRRRAAEEPALARGVEPFLLAGLVVAVAAALLPLVVMGRRPMSSEFDSRFWAPVLPFALVASAGVLALVLRMRFLWLLAPLFALVACSTLVTVGFAERHELERVSAWAPQLREHLSDEGLNLAIFENGWEPAQRLPNDYELTARLTQDWSPEERLRFWAVPNYLWTRRKEATSGIDFGGNLDAPAIDRTTRHLSRIGPIDRVMWVYVTPEGKLEIHPADATR